MLVVSLLIGVVLMFVILTTIVLFPNYRMYVALGGLFTFALSILATVMSHTTKMERITVNHEPMARQIARAVQVGDIDFETEINNRITKARNDNNTTELYRLAQTLLRGLLPTGNFEGEPPRPLRAVQLYEEVGQRGMAAGFLGAASIMRYGVPNVLEPNATEAVRLEEQFQQAIVSKEVPFAQAPFLREPATAEPIPANHRPQFNIWAANVARTPPPRDRARTRIDLDTLRDLRGMGIIINVEDQMRGMQRFLMQMEQNMGINEPLVEGGQNVHDHAVGATTREVLAHMRAAHNPENDVARPLLSRQILAIIDDPLIDVRTRQREKARTALQRIMNTNAVDSVTGVSEIDALEIVFSDITRLIEEHPQNANHIKETLVVQMAEAVEFGRTVCDKGRFEHIVAMTQGIDEHAPAIISDAQMREYALTRVGHVRNEVLVELGEEKTSAYNAGLKDIEDEVKAMVRDRLHAELVTNTKYLTEGTFTNVVGEYIESL